MQFEQPWLVTFLERSSARTISEDSNSARGREPPRRLSARVTWTAILLPHESAPHRLRRVLGTYDRGTDQAPEHTLPGVLDMIIASCGERAESPVARP